ncbi:MAG: class I SAM-dependent RNA methyltransferase [Alphaproteobacteria bacterium]|nr:class I SAM-dependent RNA methyltransferase [Alphaproteobacteria bacterium]
MARRPRYVVARPVNRPFEARTAEIEIERLGARGDGIGSFNGTPVFIPLTLPGEKVLARIEGKRGDGFTASVIEWLVQAPDRAKPACKHFGICGGCSVQHVMDSRYVAWKRGIAVQALGRVGVAESLIAPLMRVPQGTRRRASFAFKKTREGMLLGFHARATHQIVDLQECPLLVPALVAALPLLRQSLATLFPDPVHGDLAVLSTESGLDVLIMTDAPLDLFKRECLAQLVHQPGFARFSWQSQGETDAETVAEAHPPQVVLGGFPVLPPPGAFLQPSKEGEAAITAQVASGLAGIEGPLLDLYSGIGSFTLPLAATHRVHAVEGNAQAAATLKRLGEKFSLSRLCVECRDLASRPLATRELDKFSGVVIDPPRTGAREQMIELAITQNIQRVVLVSCNPATLARDLSILLENRWHLDSVVPIDQFLWAPHLEMTAQLHRTITNS